MNIELPSPPKTAFVSKKYSSEACKRAQATSTITLTFGDQAENHQGIQKLGSLAKEGFSIQELEAAKQRFEAKNCQCELIDLNDALSDANVQSEPAKILIVRQGVNFLNEQLTADMLFEEQMNLEWDTKAFMYGQVRNKHARSNLCYGEENQEPDYMAKKGRIIAFRDIPFINVVRSHLGEYFGSKGEDLVCEANNYFDVSKCGIGFHGDAERKRVIAVRIGASMPLHYQWFLGGEPIGKRVVLTLKHGDIYVMSEKATGFDCMMKKKPILRHAAGAKKYLEIKGQKEVSEDNGNKSENTLIGMFSKISNKPEGALKTKLDGFMERNETSNGVELENQLKKVKKNDTSSVATQRKLEFFFKKE